MRGLAACTVVATNYLAHARVLAHSLSENHPDVPLYTLVIDYSDTCFDPRSEPFEVLRLEDLGVSDLTSRCFRYSCKELATSSKPLVLHALLERGFDQALFLDSDMLVMGSLGVLVEEMRRGSIAVTPHLLQPPSGANRIQRELNILRSGVLNGGVVGLGEGKSARRFLDRWSMRLATHSQLGIEHGLHYDQRWLHLVGSYSEDLVVIRDPTINVAYWTVPERSLRMDGETLLVNGEPCRLFHFSGFDPRHPERPSKYAKDLSMRDLGSAATIFERYASLLRAAGAEQTLRLPYSFGRFDDGVEIPAVARLVYGQLGETADRFGNPFAVGKGSFREWLCEPVDGRGWRRRRVSRLWNALYGRRPDLQAAFPDHLGADRVAFCKWIRESDPALHEIDAAFL